MTTHLDALDPLDYAAARGLIRHDRAAGHASQFTVPEPREMVQAEVDRVVRTGLGIELDWIASVPDHGPASMVPRLRIFLPDGTELPTERLVQALFVARDEMGRPC